MMSCVLKGLEMFPFAHADQQLGLSVAYKRAQRAIKENRFVCFLNFFKICVSEVIWDLDFRRNFYQIRSNC